ncbi:Rha family transcriptional regulator [Paenibacillus sp. MMO-58]|uniref:Rha family transcriptional regulator n=1 Tax=Paenibacillus sp. MMO-58 TaxID=3081290 RepID=UPI0030183978
MTIKEILQNKLVQIENGRPVTDSLTVAEAFGKQHKDVLRDIRCLGTSEDFNQRNFAPVDYKDAGGRTYQKYIMTQDGFTILAMGYTGSEAMRFKEMYINEFNRMREELKRIEQPRTGIYDDPALLPIKTELLVVEVTANMLGLPNSGKLKLLQDLNERNNIKVALPAYVEEEATESATTLLNRYAINMTPVRFNKLMMDAGLLEEKFREGSGGELKKFKSLTETGQRFGKNLISPKQPRDTQPHYFESKFLDLIELLENLL